MATDVRVRIATAWPMVNPWLASTGNADPAAGAPAWFLTDLQGWFGALPIRAATFDQPLIDGTLDGPVFLGPRTVTITGSVIAASRTDLLAALDVLDGLLTAPNLRKGWLAVDEVERAVWRKSAVRLAGPTMAKRTGPISADYSVALLAPDPTRYPQT